MIEIIVYNEEGKKQKLDLPQDLSLTMDITSSLFNKELSGGSFSWPVDLPWTDQNRKILGSPEMLETIMQTELPFWIVDIIENGIPEMVRVKMTLLKVKGNFAYTRGTYTMTITGGESRFGALIKDKTLKDLTLTGIIDFPQTSEDSRGFANNFMHGSYPQWKNKIAFAPIQWFDYIDSGRSDYDNERITGEVVNNIMYTGNAWLFASPLASNPAAPAASGSDGYINHRTIPYFNLHYVLSCIFQEFGYKLTGDFLNDPDYACLYLLNNRALEVYRPSFHLDRNRTIVPSNHMPKKRLPEVLAAICGAFNLALNYRSGSTFELIYKRKKIREPQTLDLTKYCTGDFETDRTPEAVDGIKFEWKWDSEDALQSDRVKEIDTKLLRGTYNTFAQLQATTFTPALKNGDLAYVRADNYYFSYDTGVAKWVFYSEAQQPLLIGNGGTDINPDVSPLLQAVGTNSNGTIYYLDMVATRQPGSYYTNSRVLTEADYGLRIFYIKPFTKNSAEKVPLTFCHNMDPAGNLRAKVSLSWMPDQGVFQVEHKEWVDLLLRTKTVKVNLIFPDNINIQETQIAKIRVGSSLYLIKSMKVNMGLRIAEAILIRC